MRHFHERPTRRLAIASIAALVFAFAYLIQPAWDNERAHYDLTRALAQGSPSIDNSLRHPALQTVDVTRFRGHAYAAKAPGLAAVSVPPYLALKTAGVNMTRSPKRLIWALHLWGVVLPAAVLLLLVRRQAERVQSGFGTVAAVSLGAGTLILPFSTVFFSHVLSATLGFAAFALLMRERENESSPRLVFAAGLAVGLAFTVDYSLALVAVALGILVLAEANRLRRAGLYASGLCLGVLPTLGFNTWAFRSPFHLSYEGWHHTGSRPLAGFFGITAPTLDNMLRILFYPGGIGPILIPAVAGAALLWRRGARVEATVPVLVSALFLVLNSASTSPLGGASPGPRYMIPVLPFLAVPLAAAFRAIPGATLGLAIGGAAFMVAATLTTALEAWDGHVVHRVITGRYVDSVASFVGLGGRAWDALFLLALGVAAVAAIVATPWRVNRHRDAVAAVVALLGWLLLATKTHGLLERGAPGEAVILFVGAATALLVTFAYRARVGLRPPSSVQSTGTER